MLGVNCKFKASFTHYWLNINQNFCANKWYFVLFILQKIGIAEIECKSHKFHNTAQIIFGIFAKLYRESSCV